MVVVWAISLLFYWERFHLPQLMGYALLTWGIYQFNHADAPQIQNAEEV
jgi:multidrug transporter EmrE-like cation transporter